MEDKRKVIAICSGGLDSVSMASLYKDEDLTFMTFNYGQKGVKEMEVVKKVADKLGANFKAINISFSIYPTAIPAFTFIGTRATSNIGRISI